MILDEPWRIEKLNHNAQLFINGLKSAGFDTSADHNCHCPRVMWVDDQAFAMTREVQHHDVFVLPVVSPAVPEGLARLRTTVTAAHEPDEIERAIDVIATAGKQIGIIQ